MRLWRVSTHDRFDGEGSRRYGARWSHIGTLIVYMSGSLALALLESLANRRPGPFVLNAHYVDVGDDAPIPRLEASALPSGWDTYPWPASAQDVGTAWAHARSSLMLSVPSAVLRVAPRLVDTERNYLINPAHPDFARLRPRSVTFAVDPRIRA